MGVQEVQAGGSGEAQRAFTRRVLRDLAAIEALEARGCFDRGPRRIGAEQELTLVDGAWQPAPWNEDILAELDDPEFVTELARYNIEFNLPPMLFQAGALTELHTALRQRIARVRAIAQARGGEVVITGIVPTVDSNHLTLDNITPRDRYYALNDAITSLRHGDFRVRIKGVDQLEANVDSILMEAINTSFQVHWQTTPGEFAADYNLAMATAGPILSACCNSPVLFGKRLWRETRIAIFQQIVDPGSDTPTGRDRTQRVRFGEAWVNESVLELFRADIARFRMLLIDLVGDEDPLAEIEADRPPKLRALQAFNSTVYRWVRPCYGITDGRPHLRIENRYLPAGPTPADETANAALWFGLMAGGREAWGDIRERLDFDDAHANFVSAAREGLGAHFRWFCGKDRPAETLLREELLPVARAGLASAGFDSSEIDRYLGVIDERVAASQTGAQWTLASVANMKGKSTRGERLRTLAAAMATREQMDLPVHAWPLARLGEEGGSVGGYERVGQYMSTDLFTVAEDDLVDLVASIMDWERIRHVPVEDADHCLVGLVSYRRLIRVLAGPPDSPITNGRPESGTLVPVRDIMERTPHTCTPDTPTIDAIRAMETHRVSCLPVVRDGKLVGIVTEHDFAQIARKLLEREFCSDTPNADGLDADSVQQGDQAK